MRLGSVPEHGEEVTGRAGDHEEVPDEVTVTQPLRGEEPESARVSQTTREHE